MPGPSTQALAEEQHKAEMERQALGARISAADKRQDNHEARCEEHYQGIRSDFNEMKGRMSNMDTKLDGIITNQAANAAVAAAAISNGRPKWWHQLVGGAVIALIGWMGSTIWSMEAAKVDALQKQPAAQVTVQQAPATPSTPAIAPSQMIPPSAPAAPVDPVTQ